MKQIVCLLAAALCALSLTGCQSKKTGPDDLSAVHQELSAQAELSDMLALSADELGTFYGIAAEDVKQFAASVNSTGIRCDEIVLIEATDEEAAARVKEQLDSRYASQLAQFETYLPDQYEILQKCGVRQDGNYVAMIVAADPAPLVKLYEAYFD